MKKCAIVFLLSVFPTIVGFAQSNSNNVTYLGSLYYDWATAYDVAAQDSIAYVACGSAGLITVNLTKPAHPYDLGQCKIPGSANSIVLSDHLAFITAGSSGLRVLDVSDPKTPFEVGAFEVNVNSAIDIAIHGSYAYLIDRDQGLVLLDITVPKEPIETSRIQTPNGARRIALKDTLAYVIDGAGDLRILSVNDPAHPFEIGHYTISTTMYFWYFTSVIIEDNIAYLTEGDGLFVMDVFNPANPRKIGSLHLDAPVALGIVKLADTVFVASPGATFGHGDGPFNQITPIDISDPSAPTIIEVPSFYGKDARSICMKDSSLIIASGSEGLRIVNRSIPIGGRYSKSYKNPAWGPQVLSIQQNMVAAGSGSAGLHLVDVSDPYQPVELASFQGNVSGVALKGNYLFSTFQGSELQIFEISSENELNPVSSVPFASAVGGITIVDTVAYIGRSMGVSTVDIADPTSPVLMHSEDYEDVSAPAIERNIACVCYNPGIRIIDISDPQNPVEVGEWTEEYIRTWKPKLALKKGVLYIPNAEEGVIVLDISDPGAPMKIGNIQTSGVAIDVSVAGDFLFIADQSGGIRVFNISNPLYPIEVGFTKEGGNAIRVAVSDQKIIANMGWNLRVYDASRALSVSIPTEGKPTHFQIVSAYPNPFNSQQTILLTVLRDELLDILIVNSLGRRVYDSGAQRMSRGFHKFLFDGLEMASGTYFIQVRSSDGSHAERRVVLIR